MKTLIWSFGLTLLAMLPVAHAQNVDDRRFVCMMQDSLQVKPGVPIEVNGKTYYGCCPMCAEKMKTEPLRYTQAKDPISKITVDKADAAIFAYQGVAYYFESVVNRNKFAAGPSQYIETRGTGNEGKQNDAKRNEVKTSQ